MQNEYRAKLQMQVRAWNNGRVQFEMNKLNRLLPSRNGLSPFGTQLIQHYRTRPDRVSLSEIVGGCLADIVDCVEGIAQGVVLNERYGSILPPPAQSIATPDAAEHQQKTKALEAARRTDFNAVTLRLRTSEGERLRAWRKILKTKAEFDIPHHHVSSHGSVKIIQLDQHNCTTLALPALTLAARQSVPQEFAGRSSIASYTPLHTVRTAPVGSLTMSDSKYSTARVRERIAVDGTVAPVTEPKITKDGLFQRPVGRTRKGMKWDSVRGIWIPTPELS